MNDFDVASQVGYNTPLETTGSIFAAGFFLLLMWLIMIALYVWSAICLMKMAKKAGLTNGWYAWVPILDIILLLQIVKRPMWWIILLIIPFVNIVASIILMFDLLKAFGKPAWWFILLLISPINLIVWGIIAFGDAKFVGSSAAPIAPPPAPAEPTM